MARYATGTATEIQTQRDSNPVPTSESQQVCVTWCLIWLFTSLQLFFKSMVIYDTECPYWDQVSLNNTRQPKPHIDYKCMFHAVLELIQGRAAGAGLSATDTLEDSSCPPATAGREEEVCGVHLGGDKVYVPRTCGSKNCEYMCTSIAQRPSMADTKGEKWGNHSLCCCKFAEPNSSAALWTYCGKYIGPFITRLS